MKKDLLTWIITLSIVLVCVCLLPMEAQAATEGYYDYIVYNEEAQITGVNLPSTTSGISIPATLGGYPVTRINYAALSQCNQLTSVVIPYTVVRIDEAAFANCTNLQHVSMQYGIEFIGRTAFNGCTSLTNITIPDSVTSIGTSAFNGCTSLSSITIPDSVTSIGSYAFNNCYGITDVYITDPNAWCKIDFADAFANPMYYGDNLHILDAEGNEVTQVVLDSTVVAIPTYAFKDCTKLTSITIPNSVTSIGNGAFGDFSNLYTIIYCGTQERWEAINIGEYNEALTSAQLQFHECENGVCIHCGLGVDWEYTISDGEVIITGYKGTETDLVIPSVIENLPVAGIGASSFQGESITSVTIPACVTKIGSRPFDYCMNLQGIWVDENNLYFSNDEHGVLFDKNKTILLRAPGMLIGEYVVPYGVTEIADLAFCYENPNYGLTSVALPEGLVSIGRFAFACCENLVNVDFPESLTTIAPSAFDNCSNLKQVHIPAGVTSLEKAFYYTAAFEVDENNPNYSSDALGIIYNKDKTILIQAPNTLYGILEIPTTVVTIGDGAFNSSEMTGINLPNGVIHIGAGAFGYCRGLASITIPNSVVDIGAGAFESCISLSDITLPNSVTTIGDGAFSGSGLTGVVIPDGVSIISNYLFHNCAKLTSIVLPDGATSIGRLAFDHCTSLTSIIIPNGVTTIGAQAFYGCVNLTSIVLPDSVKSIDYGAFSGGNSLTSVIYCGTQEQWNAMSFGHSNESMTRLQPQFHKCENGVCVHCGLGVDWEYTIADGEVTINGYTGKETELVIPSVIENCPVTAIGEGAFLDCTGLTSVVVSDGIANIGRSAFSGCAGLLSVTIPNSVTSIEEWAFSACKGLSDITIPQGVTSIGGYAFAGCTGLVNIYIPDSITYFGYYVFLQCDNLTCSVYDNAKYIGNENNPYVVLISATSSDISECIIHPNAKYIKEDAFWSCINLRTIDVPDSVIRIGCYAFFNCSSLRHITIGSGVTDLNGEGQFLCCSALTEIIIPDGVNKLGANVFDSCVSLKSVVLPESVTGIGNGTFSGCANLTTVTYCGTQEQWDTVNIGQDNENLANAQLQFHECENGVCVHCGLGVDWEYTITDGEVTINGYKGAETELVIPDKIEGLSVTSIGDSAFEERAELTSIIIPDSVTSIGNYAFYWCNGLTSINIPDGVTSIGNGAFGYCERLTSINIPNSVTCIGDFAFYWCGDLISINIPDGVTSIGEAVFSGCSGLTSITIPDSVTSIGDDAFYWCGMTSIIIPDSVTSIGNYAFYGCTSLKHVLYTGTEDQWNLISIGSYNTDLTGAMRHYNCTGNEVTSVEGCSWTGRYCSICDKPISATAKETAAHNFVNGVCTVCGVEEVWKYTISANGVTINRYTGTGKEVSIPDTIDGLPVAGIGEYAFSNCSNLRVVLIPLGVETIQDCAFANCSNLERVYYKGTQADWDAISIGDDNSCLTSATIYHNFEGDSLDDVVFTVQFKNWDGAVISTNTYYHGDKVTVPTNPTRAADNTYTYTFKGWDNEVVNCAGDATYTATYTPTYINYTVVFKNWDGSIISSNTYHWGDTVVTPTNPAKAADNTYTYAFMGWDKAVVSCAGNATYTATYLPSHINYTVVFEDWNGVILSTRIYHYGDVVTTPSNPSKAADNTYTYAFAGWNKTVVNCTGNATYTATYAPSYINYTVVFKNWDGTVLSTRDYHWGDVVTAPAKPTRPDDSKNTYTFAGWDKAVVSCAGNATYTANYTAKSRVPDQITSEKHPVKDGMCSKISLGTTIGELKANLGANQYVEVYFGESKVSSDAPVGTGMVIKLMDGNTVKDTVTVVVTGDTNGDGKLTITDMISAKAHLLQKSTLEGAYAQACDTNGDGKISITDFIQFKAHVLGKSSVIPN